LGVIGFGAFSCGPVDDSDKPIALTKGVWKDGTIVNDGDQIWYSVEVTSGKTYYLYQNDAYRGDGTKTADISVSGKYENSSTYEFGFSTFGVEPDGKYNVDAEVFVANKSGTFLLLVQEALWPITDGETGTFAIYFDDKTLVSAPLGSEQNPFVLTAGDWANLDSEYTYDDEDFLVFSERSTTAEIWFEFEVEEGEEYSVFWLDDFADGNGECDADIRVTGYLNTSTSPITIPETYNNYAKTLKTTKFENIDTAYTNVESRPITFTPTADGYVRLRVKQEPSSSYGRYPDDTSPYNAQGGGTPKSSSLSNKGDFDIVFVEGTNPPLYIRFK